MISPHTSSNTYKAQTVVVNLAPRIDSKSLIRSPLNFNLNLRKLCIYKLGKAQFKSTSSSSQPGTYAFNLQSYPPSLHLIPGKEGMIHLLVGLHVQNPKSVFFSDWSKNKKIFGPRSNWLHDCMFDFWCNFKIMAAAEEDANCEFFTALTSSLEDFIHKSLKDEQTECIQRIVCLKEDVLVVLPTAFGRSVQKSG